MVHFPHFGQQPFPKTFLENPKLNLPTGTFLEKSN